MYDRALYLPPFIFTATARIVHLTHPRILLVANYYLYANLEDHRGNPIKHPATAGISRKNARYVLDEDVRSQMRKKVFICGIVPAAAASAKLRRGNAKYPYFKSL